MDPKISKLAGARQNKLSQVDAQRMSILDAAEKLFLEKGLENTNMSDIADKAGITRVTLYRYFPDRHPIAFEIAVREISKIAKIAGSGNGENPFEIVKDSIFKMIDQFHNLKDAYYYMGMFDNLYGNHYPNEQLATWYKQKVHALGWDNLPTIDIESVIQPYQIAMVGNSTISFMEKLASRGELLSGEQEIPVDDQLRSFREMISAYFDHLVSSSSNC